MTQRHWTGIAQMGWVDAYLYSRSCIPDDMILVKGAFHSTARVRAACGWAVGRCYADVTAADAPARFCGADGLAVGSVAGWATVVAELEFQCLQEISERQGMSLNYSSVACQTSGLLDGRTGESGNDCGASAIDWNTLTGNCYTMFQI